MSNSPPISLQDYLKQTLSTNENNNDFVVDLDVISKWLSVRKDSIKKTLTETYIKDIDYIVKKQISTSKRSTK